MIRVMLVDDHAIMRAGVRALIRAEADMDVVGEAEDGASALTMAADLQPDVVVMDLNMPGMNGIAATRRITSDYPQIRVLVLTMQSQDEYVFQVIDAGGSGYVLKSSADSDLIGAIRAVHSGQAFLYPSATRRVLEAYRGIPAKAAPAGGRLTDRESDVLRLTAEGYSNAEIAVQLAISPKTVDTYRQRIMDKLGLYHRPELVRFALEAGLLRPASEPLA